MKEKIKQKLDAARAGLLATLEGLDDAGWSATVYAEGDSWSVADLVGHLADAEWGMTRLVQQIQQGGQGLPQILTWSAGMPARLPGRGRRPRPGCWPKWPKTGLTYWR